MNSYRFAVIAAASALGLAACGGGGGGTTTATGSLTLSLTDGPMMSVDELVVHVESLELRRADGSTVYMEPLGGPTDIDLASLRDGHLHDLLDQAQVPAGSYMGVGIGIDPDRSHVSFSDGSMHQMQFADPNGLEVHAPFSVGPGAHAEFVIDVDLGQSLQMHHGGMGGGMMGGTGDYYEFHSATRMIDVNDAGGLTGTVDIALVNINHPDCDPVAGANWAYLFPGTAAEPDDVTETEADGLEGPVATDRVELRTGVGEYRYHFAFLEPGSYRVAFTCSGEWDEAGDDDYPADPEGRFGFQAFSEPAEVVAGQVTVLDIAP